MNEMINSADPQAELVMIEASAKRMTLAAQFAEAVCNASVLPVHLRTTKRDGKVVALTSEEVKANCIMVASQAYRWGVDPFAIMPSTFVIGGKLGFDGKLIAAIVNKLGGLQDRLSYTFEGEGDNRTVTVSGTIAGESQPRTVQVRVKDAKTTNDIWKKDPDQKLTYTGATRWARRHCPEVLLGLFSEEEVESVTIDTVAEPVGSIASATSPDPQDPIEEMAESYINQIEDAESNEDLERIGERIRAELALTEDMKTVIGKHWLTRSKELIEASRSDTYKRWLKSITTESDRTKLVNVAAEMDADDSLVAEEKKALGSAVQSRMAELDG